MNGAYNFDVSMREGDMLQMVMSHFTCINVMNVICSTYELGAALGEEKQAMSHICVRHVTYMNATQ